MAAYEVEIVAYECTDCATIKFSYGQAHYAAPLPVGWTGKVSYGEFSGAAKSPYHWVEHYCEECSLKRGKL